MALTTAINIVLIATVIVCAWQGFKKGIIMGIIEVLVIILSLYGAQLLSDTFSYEVIPAMQPFVSGFMENRVEDAVYEAAGYDKDKNGEYIAEYSVADLLDQQYDGGAEICFQVYRGLGLYSDMADNLSNKTITYAQQNNAPLTAAVTAVLCQSITWCGGFLLAFLLLFTVLIVLVNLPNLSFRIPYVGIVNDIGGLGIGVFTGFLFCAVIVWALQFTGLIVPEETMRSAGAVGFFLDKNMLSNYVTF